MKDIAFLVAASLCAQPALSCDELDEVVGYTLVAHTNVRGSFEGCDHDKLIEFDNGWILRCSEYGYSYAYHPDAFIFAKRITYQGRTLTILKVCIDDEMYDMRER